MLLDNVQLTADIPARLFTDATTVNYADALITKIWHRCLDMLSHRKTGAAHEMSSGKRSGIDLPIPRRRAHALQVLAAY